MSLIRCFILSSKIITAYEQIFKGGGEGYYETEITGFDAIRLYYIYF